MRSLQDYITQAQRSVQDRKIWVGQFIDDFKSEKKPDIFLNQTFSDDPVSKLFEAILHQLCIDYALPIPAGLKNPSYLKTPYFVSDLPNSRFLALRDSPYAFKIRNIYVPYNYLSRY